MRREDKQQEKLDRVEQLLRMQPGATLSPRFRQQVMAEINRLPAPRLVAPPTPQRGIAYALSLISPGERALGLALVLVGIALLLPGTGELLGAWDWQVADLTVAISIGETALSASLVSVLAAMLGLAFTTFVGAYSARHKLIGV